MFLNSWQNVIWRSWLPASSWRGARLLGWSSNRGRRCNFWGRQSCSISCLWLVQKSWYYTRREEGIEWHFWHLLQSMNSNRLQRSMKYVFILSPSLPFDLKYVELWHARVLLLYNTNRLTAFNAAVKKRSASQSWWSHFPGKADQSRRGDLEWGGHQLSSATLALRCLLIIILMITMLMMEVMTIATLNLFIGDGHVKFLLSCQTETFLALYIDIAWIFLLIQGSDQGTTWKR